MDNETTTESIDNEYSVPEWWTNSYGRSNSSYWD